MYTFISGATGGIGKAFCFECAKRGYDLFLTGRSQDNLNVLQNQLKEYNVSVLTCACDLRSEGDRQSLLDYAKINGVTFERLIMVAGIDTQMAFESYTLDKVQSQIRVNVESTVCLAHQLLSVTADGGEVLVISSMSGVSPMPYFALYSATKAMLTNFFTSLHYELKARKIKVTTVLPGGVYTRPDVIADIKGQGVWGRLSAKTPEFIAQKSLKAVRKNKLTYVPGFFNKLLKFLMKIAPKRIVLSFIAKRWQKQTKDAF